MSSPQVVDQELLDNLDLLLAMDVLEKESDWDALGAEGLTEAPDEDLEATQNDRSSETSQSGVIPPDDTKPAEASKEEE